MSSRGLDCADTSRENPVFECRVADAEFFGGLSWREQRRKCHRFGENSYSVLYTVRPNKEAVFPTKGVPSSGDCNHSTEAGTDGTLPVTFPRLFGVASAEVVRGPRQEALLVGAIVRDTA